MPTEPLVYTLEEAANALTLGRSTVWKLVRQGRLRVVRVGKRVLVPKKEIDRLLNGVEK